MDERNVTTSGAWLASIAGMGVLVVVGQHVPYMVGWLLNTVVILGVSWGICRYKRSRPARVCFWTLAAVCAVEPFLKLAGVMGSDWTDAYLVVVVATSVAWYWLLRVPAVRPDAPPEVQHVVHHHVIEGTGAAVPAAVPVPAPHVTIPGSVERPAIGAGRIFAGVTIPDGVLQRIGRR